MAIECNVERSIEERMARTDESSEPSALRCNQRFFKGDALVTREYRFTRSDHAIAIAHRRGDIGYFVAARLPLSSRAADLSECFKKK